MRSSKGEAVNQWKEAEPALRGYCRMCNRYALVKNGLQTESIQIHQHHTGVCQTRNFYCARILASMAWAETNNDA
jgi:hypothetical protein